MRAQGHKSTRNANDLCTDDLCSFVKAELSPELPKGCELLSVNIAKANTSFQPCSATYVLAVRKEYLSGKLKAAIARLLASESLKVQRQIDKRRTKVKNLDVREFLKSIKLDDRSIIVECRISSAGSIRVEEILTLLGLSEYKLAAPIRRTSVQWQEA
jgi:rhodanese-related sulfurtransferase